MNCPICQSPCERRDVYCSHCGRKLPERKGTHLVPILIMTLLVIAGLILFFVSSGHSAAPAVSSATPWFSISGGTLSFDESKYSGPSDVTIPSTVNGEPVLRLSDGCFRDCSSITTVYLPDSLLGIGSEAFSGCTALRGIYIPESVTEIGPYAFSGCSDLESVCILDSISSIGAGCFEECNRLYYIFFLGSFADWGELYSEFINPYTAVFCADGSFFQGGDPY